MTVGLDCIAAIEHIVGSWPGAWDTTTRARALGCAGNDDFDSVVRA
jgi:hypothetical protein